MINKPNYNKEKPKTLYRGITISYQLLQNFKFSGVDLVPPNPPIVDEKGRKTVNDGNEYGVYMSDYDLVARTVYAAVDKQKGTPLKKDVVFGDSKMRTVIPSVGIVYKINTDNIDAHIPWITSYLKGHYNNGMGGDEWVVERIPADNYSVDTVEIGQDTLHESEFIDVSDVFTIREKALAIINQRKERLELFESKIESMTPRERLLLDNQKIKILKSIYKLNGIMDIDVNNFEPNSANDYLDYLMGVIYSRDKDNIDFKTLMYIDTLKDRVRKETTIDEIINRIRSDMEKNEEKKNFFVEKKKLAGESYSTNFFDNKIRMYEELLKELDEKANKKEKKEESESQTSVINSAKEAIYKKTRTGTVNKQAQTINEQAMKGMNPDIEKDSNDLGLDDE